MFIAIMDVQMMVNSPGFDRQMLHLATQLAHEKGMKRLLAVILKSLFSSLTDQDGQPAESSDSGLMAATVLRWELRSHFIMDLTVPLRCLVRLTIEMLAVPTADP
jgi:hypothetical protein